MLSFAGEEEKEDSEEVPRNVTPAQSEHLHRDDGHAQRSVWGGESRRKPDEDKVHADSYFMKTFAAQAARRDEYSVFGEHIANRLRKCGRSHYEMVIAQHKIENIVFDLEMGAYDKTRYQHHPHYVSPQANWHNPPPAVTRSEPAESSVINVNHILTDDVIKEECSDLVMDEDVDDELN